MKTIRELSEEIGVTKAALQKRISREPLRSRLSPSIDMRNGTKYIDEAGEQLIKEAFGAGMDKPIDMSTDKGIDGHGQAVDTLIAMLERELAIKNDQIKDLTAANRELTAALENTTNSLQASQALHAGTMHKQLTDGQQEAVEVQSEAPDKKPGLWDRLFKKKNAD